MPKRKSSAALGGLAKRRKTSVKQDVKKIKKILSEGQEWKHVRYNGLAMVPLVSTAPLAVCLNLIAAGTGPQQRNGLKCFLQKGVCSFQIHWGNIAGQTFHPVRCMVVCALRQNNVGSAGTFSDTGRGQVILNEILTGNSSAYNYSSTFPQVCELTALKTDGNAFRSNYLILHDKVYTPKNVTEYYDGATRKGTGGYINKKITWSLKNHEMVFQDSTDLRPRERQVWVIFYTTESTTNAIQMRADYRQTFTENKLD